MSTTKNLHFDQFVLDTGCSGVVLKATMKRYRPVWSVQRGPQVAGYILLFAHGTGFHKELWEPTIEHLFEKDKGNRGSSRVLEAWAIDCQNHGEAAHLNDDVLLANPRLSVAIHDYGDAIVRLCKSGLLGNVNQDVHKVVLVGHSAGAIGVIIAAARSDLVAEAALNMVILVDMPMYAPNMKDNGITDVYRFIVETTPARRYMWPSKEDAHHWMKTRAPYKFWDPQVLALYANYGLRELPTPFHPNQTGVVLICSPIHEAAAYGHAETQNTLKAIEQMNRVCAYVPVHLVFGARNDMFSRELQDLIPDSTAGRVISSIRRVKGAGHLVVQEKPEGLANAIFAILNQDQTPSKL